MKTLFTALLLSTFLLQPVLSAEKAPTSAQRLFDTPAAAADAFIQAAKANDSAVLIEIFGAEHKDLIGTADPERDRELRAKFALKATEHRRLLKNDDGSVTLVAGYEAWAFPIPVVKSDKGWYFDTAAGADEVVKRRIGANELSALDSLRGYVEAQRLYAAQPRDGSGVRQFAQLLTSSPGKKDGLYWKAAEGEASSPAGPEIKDSKTPNNGYYFKILTAQGADAPAGQFSYLINGKYIGGFAMIAWPVEYGDTGIMTLLVNHYGDIYEKDLGKETGQLAPAITEYNPDKTWKKVED